MDCSRWSSVVLHAVIDLCNCSKTTVVDCARESAMHDDGHGGSGGGEQVLQLGGHVMMAMVAPAKRVCDRVSDGESQ